MYSLPVRRASLLVDYAGRAGRTRGPPKCARHRDVRRPAHVTPSEPGPGPKVSSLLRADLIIAMCALLISSLACIAAVWQTRVIGEQLSANVWPYLDFTTSSTSNTGKPLQQDELSVSVTNDGLGPAVVKSVTLTLSGRHFNDVDSVVTAIVPNRYKVNGSISSSNITPGSVIRPSETITILDAKGSAFVAPLRKRAATVDVAICYCSILKTCWVVRVASTPRDVASCS
jgi:hypothetical protein